MNRLLRWINKPECSTAEKTAIVLVDTAFVYLILIGSLLSLVQIA
jgi:hypothetical protein